MAPTPEQVRLRKVRSTTLALGGFTVISTVCAAYLLGDALFDYNDTFNHAELGQKFYTASMSVISLASFLVFLYGWKRLHELEEEVGEDLNE